MAARHRLLALFLLAVGVRLLYIYTTPPESPIGSTDAWGYHRLALNLDRGNGFSLRRQAPYVPDSVRTPLYPAFLLLIRRTLGRSLRAAVVVQALLDGLTTLGTYALAAHVSSALGIDPPASRRTGRLAALLYALHLAQVRTVNELLTETLLSFLLTCGLCVLVRILRARSRAATGTQDTRALFDALALGVLAGLAALCKPNVQFLPLIWFTCILIAGRRRQGREGRPCVGASVPWPPLHWRSTGLAALAFLAVVAPWIARNALAFGRPFLSTAFEGNVSRVSAPAALVTARGEYAIPWSDEWEAAFGEIVARAAERYDWDKPWETLTPRELDVANHQVYRVAREVLSQHPLAWLGSHALGMLRYLEPQSYRILHARWTGRPWPPDVLEDAVLHTVRGLVRGEWYTVGQIIGQERWARISPLQRGLWWGTFLAQMVALVLILRGAWFLRTHPALAIGLLGTLAYVLWLPGPIAYERFRVPVMSGIATLTAVATIARGQPSFQEDRSR